MITRKNHIAKVRSLLRDFPLVGIIGARQVGKTTLAQQISSSWKSRVTHFDLENPEDLARLRDPMLTLEPLKGLVILDEIQHRPDLFPVLRVLADRSSPKTRFLLLGSSSPMLLQRSSETLAGRIAYHTLPGFSISEIGDSNLQRLWVRGSFPRSFLARSEGKSLEWRREFVRTYFELQFPPLGIQTAPETLRRFWMMLAHYHGQVWNASEFARAFGMSDKVVRGYLDLLTATFAVRKLSPFFENIGKRQIKAPKVYIADSGMLHGLLGIQERNELLLHPKVGASWEGFALETIIQAIGARPEECYFWGTYSGAELDLLVVRGRQRWGFEIKHTTTPKVTRSMNSAIESLALTQLDVIYAGKEAYSLTHGIRAIPLERILDELHPPKGFRRSR